MTTPQQQDWQGAATRLVENDITAVAAALSVDVPAMKAVLQVEAAGSGFDSAGRPKILFEGHVFWRNLAHELREEANRQGLAWSHWEAGRYALTSEGNYQRLEAACAIDPEAAMKACSWGIAQVLGENHAMIGFASVEDMVLAAMAGEREQLDMMAAYIDAANLEIPLREHDWAGFAQGYNGPRYAERGYHIKLHLAYEAFAALVPPPVVVSEEAPPIPDEPRATEALHYEEPGGQGG